MSKFFKKFKNNGQKEKDKEAVKPKSKPKKLRKSKWVKPISDKSNDYQPKERIIDTITSKHLQPFCMIKIDAIKKFCINLHQVVKEELPSDTWFIWKRIVTPDFTVSMLKYWLHYDQGFTHDLEVYLGELVNVGLLNYEARRYYLNEDLSSKVIKIYGQPFTLNDCWYVGKNSKGFTRERYITPHKTPLGRPVSKKVKKYADDEVM